MDPALTFAIFRRLTGYPLDARGNPLIVAGTSPPQPQNIDGKWGIRLPVRRGGTTPVLLDSHNPDSLRLWGRGYEVQSYRQVPVCYEGPDSKRWEDVFPRVAFVVSGLETGTDPFIYDPDDDDGIGIDVGTQTITNPVTGTTRETTDHRSVRRNPEPWDVTFTITMYAKDPIEIQLLERSVLQHFGQMGAILVEQLDGTMQTRDYRFERYIVMDQGETYDPAKGLGPTGDAFLKRGLVFVFETFLDNSIAEGGFGSPPYTDYPTVLERLMDVRDIQNRYLETANLEELTP